MSQYTSYLEIDNKKICNFYCFRGNLEMIKSIN